MKKKIVISLLGFVICMAAHSQVDPNAIGLRIGGGDNFGAEISYQHGFSHKNRLELDLGAGGNDHYSRLALVGMYHWAWKLGNEGFNWFVGPGAGLSLNNGKHGHNDYVGVGIGGQIGLGFNFRIPLQLTLDTRPMWNFLAEDDDNDFGWGFALGIRYRF